VFLSCCHIKNIVSLFTVIQKLPAMREREATFIGHNVRPSFAIVCHLIGQARVLVQLYYSVSHSRMKAVITTTKNSFNLEIGVSVKSVFEVKVCVHMPKGILSV